MRSWEQTSSKILRVLRMETIRGKILVFAIAATLIPSLATAWLSYTHSRRSVAEKIHENLRSLSAQTSRRLDLWMNERIHELRVFKSSYQVSENLERLSRDDPAEPRRGSAQERLTDYLNSVRRKFPDFEELLVLDSQGRVVARSARRPGELTLPEDWSYRVQTELSAVSETSWDPLLRKTVMMVAVPIDGAHGLHIGSLTGVLNLRSVDEILQRNLEGTLAQMYLITKAGRRIVTAPSPTPELDQAAVRASSAQRLFEDAGTVVEYVGIDGEDVVGTLRVVPRLDWGVVAEVPAQEAFRQVERLRNWTLLMVTVLLLTLGSIAYWLGLLIVQPLDRLTTGAAKVAAGDLDVDLPVVSGGEVGYLTEVFNNMVDRLREKNEALEELSVTDALTGLFNRRHLMDALAAEVRRSERHRHHFSVLIGDIDHFKGYNDRMGHLAGDAVLARVGAILQDAIRGVDFAARYGGEEFMAILPETSLDEAMEVADRIRSRVADEHFEGGQVTLSVGAAEFPGHGKTPEALIASADAALYRAKREGRNRVIRAGAELRARRGA